MRQVTITRRKDNTIYFDCAVNTLADGTLMQPGDQVVLSGDYLWIKIWNIPGVSGSPITFTNDVAGVTVGGFLSYTMQLTGKYFALNGKQTVNGMGIKLWGGAAGAVGANGLYIGNSTNVEVSGVEFTTVQSGIQCNPTDGILMENFYIHDNNMHDIGTMSRDQGRSEGIYFGNTHGYYSQCRFVNCIITRNSFINCTGNAVQVGSGDFNITANYIENAGTSLLAGQSSSVQFGGNGMFVFDNNQIVNGKGKAFDAYGGNVTFSNNDVINNDATGVGATEDVIYLNGKDGGVFNVSMYDNNFKENKGRYIVNNGTNLVYNAGGHFINNVIASDNVASVSIWNLLANDTLVQPPAKKAVWVLWNDGSWSAPMVAILLSLTFLLSSCGAGRGLFGCHTQGELNATMSGTGNKGFNK